MLIVRHKFGKRVVKMLMTSAFFNRHFAVLTWGKSYVLTRTKPVDELISNKITEDNILTLKFKYHSSHSVLKEYVAEIDNLNYEKQKLHLNIWTNELKTNLITQTELTLTQQTNEALKKLLDAKVFNEKYGDNYNYFITLYLNPDIIKAGKDDRQFSEITLKYSLKPDDGKSEKRHKTKCNISKNEARKLCSVISYWNI